jgi:hypothetical protein
MQYDRGRSQRRGLLTLPRAPRVLLRNTSADPDLPISVPLLTCHCDRNADTGHCLVIVPPQIRATTRTGIDCGTDVAKSRYGAVLVRVNVFRRHSEHIQLACEWELMALEMQILSQRDSQSSEEQLTPSRSFSKYLPRKNDANTSPQSPGRQLYPLKFPFHRKHRDKISTPRPTSSGDFEISQRTHS